MAKKTNSSAEPLASPANRAWLEAELAKAEALEAEGPGGSWKHNESLAPEIIERAAFLRALVALLPK